MAWNLWAMAELERRLAVEETATGVKATFGYTITKCPRYIPLQREKVKVD
jgi:hypothetical protein